MDAFPGISGYKYTFFVMLAFSVIGLVASIILYRMIKKQHPAADDTAEAE